MATTKLDLSNYPIRLTYPKAYRPRSSAHTNYFSRVIIERVWVWLKETYHIQPFLMGSHFDSTSELQVFVKDSPNRPDRRHYKDGREVPDIIVKLGA